MSAADGETDTTTPRLARLNDLLRRQVFRFQPSGFIGQLRYMPAAFRSGTHAPCLVPSAHAKAIHRAALVPIWSIIF